MALDEIVAGAAVEPGDVVIGLPSTGIHSTATRSSARRWRASHSTRIRKAAEVGYEIDDPLPVPPIFTLIQERGEVSDAEMSEVFNMGCGFCLVVAEADEAPALERLRAHYPEAKRIGRATEGPPRIL